jgi:hypothetical protein
MRRGEPGAGKPRQQPVLMGGIDQVEIVGAALLILKIQNALSDCYADVGRHVLAGKAAEPATACVLARFLGAAAYRLPFRLCAFGVPLG